MTGVRNGPLARVLTSAVGWTHLGTVPTGFTWLMKTVQVINAGTVEANVIVQQSSADGKFAARLPTFTLAPDESAMWSGWVAMAEKDQLAVNGPASIYVWMSGAELPGVSSAGSF